MKLIDLKNRYNDYFDLYSDCYTFDDLYGSKSINDLINYFETEGYVFSGFVISFEGDHSDINLPIRANSKEELINELGEINHSIIDNIGSVGEYGDQMFNMDIYPNKNKVIVKRTKKKEIEEQKQM